MISAVGTLVMSGRRVVGCPDCGGVRVWGSPEPFASFRVDAETRPENAGESQAATGERIGTDPAVARSVGRPVDPRLR